MVVGEARERASGGRLLTDDLLHEPGEYTLAGPRGPDEQGELLLPDVGQQEIPEPESEALLGVLVPRLDRVREPLEGGAAGGGVFPLDTRALAMERVETGGSSPDGFTVTRRD